MTLVNTLRKQVDLPIWESLRYAPAVSSALSATCAPKNTQFSLEAGRYIYFLLTTGSFWKYDTIADSYVGLSSPFIAPLLFNELVFHDDFGYEGMVLAAASQNFTAPAYYSNNLAGYDMRIVSGTGAGQMRTITSVADPVVADSGVTTTATALILTDSTKAWTTNQYAGYNLRITYGAGISQVRRILYNDATNLYYTDVNIWAGNNDCNPSAPLPAFGAVAGSQSIYAIESSVITVDSAWATQPDTTSKFRVFSGRISMISSAASPFYTSQEYDIASDTWYIKTSATAMMPLAGTDGAIEATSEFATVNSRGVATSGSTTTLVDTSQAWQVNAFVGDYVYIYSGTGEGEVSLIASNTATTLTFATLGTAPAAGSRYLIQNLPCGTATAGGASTLTDSGASWPTNRWANYRVRIVKGTGAGQVMPIASNTGTVLTLYEPWTTNPDSTSVYNIVGNGDNMYMAFGGQASVMINSHDADLPTWGRLNYQGSCCLGSAQLGGNPPVAITSGAGAAGTITITTAYPHGFKTGQTIKHLGDTGASAVQNNISAAITVTGISTYTYTAAGSTAAWTLPGLTTTTLVDASKNWTTNEHANKICYFTTVAPAIATGVATMVAMEIASNTANTLTFKTATTTPVNGTSRYIIAPRSTPGQISAGIATGAGQLTTALQDTSQNWVVNLYAGKKVKFLSGAGMGQESTITSNTSNTLTFAAGTLPVAASTSYAIVNGSILGTGIEMRWGFGESDTTKSGKFIYVPRGGGVIGFNRLNLTTDLWDILSTSPEFETLTTGSMFAYDGGDRLYFTKEVTQRVYYLDLNKLRIEGAGQYPYLAGTAILGNRMEIFTTADGLKYMWLNRHSFQDCFRQLLFF